MFILFGRTVVVPVGVVALGVVALGAPPLATALVVVLFGSALIGFTALVLVRWLRRFGPRRMEVLPARGLEPAPAGIIVSAGAFARPLNETIDARTLEARDGADLIRMDSDAG